MMIVARLNPDTGDILDFMDWRDDAPLPVNVRLATPDEVAALTPPPVVPIISPRQWLDRLSLDKQTAIFVAAAANAQLLGLVIYATGGPTLDPTDPRTAQGVNAFVGAGVLTEEDGALLLAP